MTIGGWRRRLTANDRWPMERHWSLIGDEALVVHWCRASPHGLDGTTPCGALEQVRLARKVGFDGVTIGNHLSYGATAWFPPFETLMRLSAEADGMSLGTCMLVLPLYHPLYVAEQVALLDAASGGRAILGVSPGWQKDEFEVMGLEQARVFKATLAELGKPLPKDFPVLRNVVIARDRQTATREVGPAIAESYRIFGNCGSSPASSAIRNPTRSLKI